MGRFLLSARRTVPAGRFAEYRAAWAELRDGVHASNGHAWLFRSVMRPDTVLEFIEWEQPSGEGDGRTPAAAPGWLEAVRWPLDENFDTAPVEVWEEVP